MNIEIYQILKIVLWFFLAGVSTFFSVLDQAIQKLSIKDIIEHKGASNLRTNLWLKNSLKLRITAKLVSSIIMIITCIIAGYEFHEYCETWMNLHWGIQLIYMLLFVSVITIIIKIFPCYIAEKYSHKIAFSNIWTLHIVSCVIWPLAAILLFFTGLIARIFCLNYKMEDVFGSDSDIDEFMAEQNENEKLEEEEHNMLKSVLEFGETIVKEVMTPRILTIAIPDNIKLSEASELVFTSAHSRYPVYSENIDNIIGILYIKDLFKNWKYKSELDNSELKNYVRKATFVPETKKVNELLREFRLNKIQMAVVIDEYGGVSGIVTLEDLLEEIVGDIKDEI